MRVFPLLVLIYVTVTGCENRDTGPMVGQQLALPAEDEFDRAIELIENAEDYDAEQARKEAVNRLNRWLEDEDDDADWLADPLKGRLPEHIRNLSFLNDLDSMQFTIPDGRFLQQATWLRDLAAWIRDSELDPLSKRRLEETRGPDGAALSEADADQLRQALLLFDWTVRNIQLDREPVVAAAEGADLPSPAGAPAGEAAQSNAPFRGIPGPGYTLFPWNVLQFGHGDAWQRASVFLLLCHQCGIDGTLLAFEEPAPAPPRPWLTATLIGGQLYLFDTSLGLALPGKGGIGLATLAQIAKEPELLRALDYSDSEGAKYDYPAVAGDMTRIVALVNAPPECLTQRMKLLEQKLAGAKKMALSMSPSLGQKLRAIPEIKDVGLWTVPYEAFVYRMAVEQQGQANPAALAERFKEEILFSRNLAPPALVIGRRLHLKGELNRRGQAGAKSNDGAAPSAEPGAKGLYLTTRMTDRDIEAVMLSKDTQEQLKLNRAAGESEEEHQMRLDNFARIMRETRVYANYWMGLAHYENRNFDTAATWLANQVLADGQSPFQSGARYNLGRARESLGERDAAIAAYREAASPQRHGNLLRAKWIEEEEESEK